jgi:hypothetical protein
MSLERRFSAVPWFEFLWEDEVSVAVDDLPLPVVNFLNVIGGALAVYR